jgi:hypothetical protein
MRTCGALARITRAPRAAKRSDVGTSTTRRASFTTEAGRQSPGAQVIDQCVTGDFALYHSDCVDVVRAMPESSIHYSIFSPPFASLYTYSNSERDMGN